MEFQQNETLDQKIAYWRKKAGLHWNNRSMDIMPFYITLNLNEFLTWCESTSRSERNSPEKRVGVAKRAHLPYQTLGYHYERLQRDMENTKEKIKHVRAEMIEEDSFQRNRYKDTPSESGDLIIERYLDRHLLPFDEPLKIAKDEGAVTIALGIGVNHGESGEEFMKIAYQKTLQMVSELEGLNQPFQIVGLLQIKFPQQPSYKIVLVIKDFNEPFLPALFEIFLDNSRVNSLCCVLSDGLMSEGSMGLGHAESFVIPKAGILNAENITLINTENAYFETE